MLKKGLTNEDVKHKFNEIADDYSFFRYTMHYKARKIRYHLSINNKDSINTRILDVGIAGAELASLYLNNQILIGIDISKSMIKKSRKKLSNTLLFQQDGEKLHFVDSYFDAVILADSLHYMENPESALSEAYRVLKSDGLIILTSRNQFYQKFEFVRKWLNIGPTDNLTSKMYYPNDLRRMLIYHNFNDIISESFCVIPINGFSFLDKTFIKFLGHFSIVSGHK